MARGVSVTMVVGADMAFGTAMSSKSSVSNSRPPPGSRTLEVVEVPNNEDVCC
jgi:hypothetical protein